MAGLGRSLAFALGAVWASPMTLAGLLAGLVAMPFGARLRTSDAALVFHRYPWGPGGALTLGNVILRFPADIAMKDMHKDLSLLLKASQIG